MAVEPHVVASSDLRIAEHEDAAHEKRNWVRLTFDCNNHCVFCLDTLTHDGQMRDRDEVKAQILDGRKKGAERLILSGGEPTMHPSYVDFIRLGRSAGYRKIQTVTNGRMFAYPEFLKRTLDAGLQEITFSVHGPNARIHDALVGVKGAFDQEITGLKAALADGRPIVNIDIVINRANVKHLCEMLDSFIAIGVREFDLLQVIPFGNAFTEGRNILFYDLEELRPYLLAAFAYSKRPDVHLWLNRFPVQHLEGYEHLIQDPYKLNDEVRGRKEEYARVLDDGLDLDCRDPERCRYCYLERLCDTLYATRDVVVRRAFSALRVDTEWEAKQEPVFGGDPASKKRAEVDVEVSSHRSLPMFPAKRPPQYLPPPALAEAAGAESVIVCAPTLARARACAAKFSTPDVELEVADYAGLAEALASDDTLDGKRLTRALAHTPAQARALLAVDGQFQVEVLLDRDTAPWLLSLTDVSPRLALYQPSYERLTEATQRDTDLRVFFAAFRHAVPVRDVPACVTGRPPAPARTILDGAMMTPEGRLEIFRYARRYIADQYRSKALRCKDCTQNATCTGLHINYVRAHGYALLQPITE